jgi:hypothetical protein
MITALASLATIALVEEIHSLLSWLDSMIEEVDKQAALRCVVPDIRGKCYYESGDRFVVHAGWIGG